MSNPDMIFAEQLQQELNNIIPFPRWKFTTKVDMCSCPDCSRPMIIVNLDMDGDLRYEGKESINRAIDLEDAKEFTPKQLAAQLLEELKPVIDFVKNHEIARSQE